MKFDVSTVHYLHVKLRDELKHIEDMDAVCKTTERTDGVRPIVMVQKKDGCEYLKAKNTLSYKIYSMQSRIIP